MRIPEKTIYIAFLLVTAFAVPTQVTLATNLQNATNQVEESHEELLEVKDDTALSPEDKLQKEIDARVNIVRTALSLSLQEISNLRDGLNKLPQFTALSRESILSEQFAADLQKSQDYYASKQNEVARTTFTLESIKELAKNIIDYRDTVYNPKTSEIVDFTLLFYNEDAIAIAKTRLAKISANIKTLEKLNIIKIDHFQAGIGQVSQLLNDSDALHLKAKAIILADPLNPAPSEPELEPIPGEAVLPAPTAQELLIQSLQNIKSVYEIFVQIGKDTKNILGIR